MLKMIRISLTESARSELKRLRLLKNTNIGERAHYVLLCSEGKSAPEIARHLNRNIITVRLWLNRYIQAGVEGLRTRKPPGRPAQKAPMIEAQLEELLHQSPQDYGYQEAGWQINVLKDWFARQGLHACDNTIVKSLSRLGYVYKRFSKTLPKNAPSAEEKRKRINEIVEDIRQNEPTDIEILFLDETHFSNQPYVSRGWFKKGEKK
jgi:transposase